MTETFEWIALIASGGALLGLFIFVFTGDRTPLHLRDKKGRRR